MAYSRTYIDDRRFRATFTGQTGIVTVSDNFADLPGSRSGTKGVDWKVKAKNGQQAGTPFTSDRAKVLRGEPGYSLIRYRSKAAPTGPVFSQKAEGFFLPLTSCAHLSISSTSVENTALSKMHKRIREETSHMNGQAFLGELAETIHMLKRPMSSLRDKIHGHLSLLENRKKGVRGSTPKKKLESWKKVIASTWLETQFGIQPLISDTKSIAESIAKFQYHPPRKAIIEAVARQSVASTSETSSVLTNGFYCVCINTNQRKTEVSCRYRAAMWTDVTADYSSVSRLRNTLGFNLENFVPALWEVLPWSWCADYFSNAGNILEAMTTDQTNVRWVVKTVRRETTWERKLRADSKLTAEYLDAFGLSLVTPSSDDLGSLTLVRKTVDRSLSDNLGVPSVEFSIPGVSSTRWLNLAAVFAQRRKTVESISF